MQEFNLTINSEKVGMSDYFGVTNLVDQPIITPFPKANTEQLNNPITLHCKPFGIVCSAWLRYTKNDKNIASRLEGGTVRISSHAMLQPDALISGFKDSGFSIEFGEAGLEEFTSVQTIQTAKS